MAGHHIRRLGDAERKRLVDAMAAFQRASGEKVEVVFDTGEPGDWLSRARGESTVKVFFARPETDADEFIKRRVASSEHPAKLTVITSDRALRSSVEAHGATATGPVLFARTVREVIEGAEAHTDGMPRDKEEGVPEDEVGHWLEYFGYTEDGNA